MASYKGCKAKKENRIKAGVANDNNYLGGKRTAYENDGGGAGKRFFFLKIDKYKKSKTVKIRFQ